MILGLHSRADLPAMDTSHGPWPCLRGVNSQIFLFLVLFAKKDFCPVLWAFGKRICTPERPQPYWKPRPPPAAAGPAEPHGTPSDQGSPWKELWEPSPTLEGPDRDGSGVSALQRSRLGREVFRSVCISASGKGCYVAVSKNPKVVLPHTNNKPRASEKYMCFLNKKLLFFKLVLFFFSSKKSRVFIEK